MVMQRCTAANVLQYEVQILGLNLECDEIDFG